MSTLIASYLTQSGAGDPNLNFRVLKYTDID